MNKEEMRKAIEDENDKVEKRKLSDEEFRKSLEALVELARLDQEMGLRK